MEIILSKQCESLTGSLGQGFGYHIQSRIDRDGKKRFWGVRNSKGSVPPDGHLRFIFTAADIARYKLHIDDIRVSGKELVNAVNEAGKFCPAYNPKHIFNADDIIKLKTNLGL